MIGESALPNMVEWQKDFQYPTAFTAWDELEADAIQRVIKSNRFTMGPEVEAFEGEFSQHMGMKHSVMVNSGSSANLIAVQALMLDKRWNFSALLDDCREVMVPALAWATTYAPLVQNRFDLTLVDCDGTWCAVPPSEVPPNTSLIIDVPILGNPGYGREWKKLADCHSIPLMVDCCESLGSWMGPYGTRTLTGTTGLVNTFSFFWSHQLSAIEGGMVLTNDDELAHLMRMLRNHGLNKPPYQADNFDEQYDFRIMGYNLRPLEMHAAIAREQLKKLETLRRHREQGLNNFITLATGLPIEVAAKIWGTVWSPFGIQFTVESRETRTRLVKAFKENGIDCRLPTGGSFTKHIYGAPWAGQPTPKADEIHSRGLFLGLAPYDITPKIERAVKVMRETL